MKTKQEMIDKIYEEIADKTLSFGCKVKLKNFYYKEEKEYIILGNEDIREYQGKDCNETYIVFSEDEKYEVKQIIGHPVMIGDVLDYLANSYGEVSFTIYGNGVINFGEWQGRFDFKKPIEEQPEDCIQFIFNNLK